MVITAFLVCFLRDPMSAYVLLKVHYSEQAVCTLGRQLPFYVNTKGIPQNRCAGFSKCVFTSTTKYSPSHRHSITKANLKIDVSFDVLSRLCFMWMAEYLTPRSSWFWQSNWCWEELHMEISGHSYNSVSPTIPYLIWWRDTVLRLRSSNCSLIKAPAHTHHLPSRTKLLTFLVARYSSVRSESTVLFHLLMR